ncbi:MAG: hypothetical protein KatS3mg022_3344 [Armatimonadota bacterium]|nr:MAG: hypothetical protein KatS3mg022_3344 [Armatimonadota bacterium]
MHKRLMAMAAVAALGIATVLWVSANPQQKASVKPAAVKSGGSCCAHEGAAKATAAQAKSDVKPAAMQGGQSECPYMAGKAKAAATSGKKDCADCPEMKATLAAKQGSKAHGECPFMKSNGKANEAKAKPTLTKPASQTKSVKATATQKATKSL